jgi:two-component system chemotaxis response regulator CheB
MGNDGSEAFAEIKKRGGLTVAESEKSSVVFGMPGELVAKGGATVVLAVERIARQLTDWANSPCSTRRPAEAIKAR